MADDPPTWTVSDGTIVRLGGEVEGSSLLALQLRAIVERGRPGITWASGDYWVDLNDLAQCDAWVRERVMRANLKVSGPKDVPPLPPPPALPGEQDLPDDETPADAVY